ncbi:MAG: SDR family oxidoreductase [Actinomycetota bacterium]
MEAGHLADRVIVITGGGSGFGRLLAEGAAARGAKVVVADIAQDAIDETVALVADAGGTAIGASADVTDLDAMHRLVAQAVEQFGGIDIMVNNAGVMPLAFYADHAEAAPAWSKCIDINIKGVLHGMIAAYDPMIEQGRGHVVNLSSIYGNHPVAGAAVYGATKAAVNVMSEVLRLESQGKIKVTTIRPTGVPSTGLGGGVVNGAAVAGILGANVAEYLPVLMGEGSPEQYDRDGIAHAVLDPSDLVAQILYAIDQPWGVSISDVTVRASGDRYVI